MCSGTASENGLSILTLQAVASAVEDAAASAATQLPAAAGSVASQAAAVRDELVPKVRGSAVLIILMSPA